MLDIWKVESTRAKAIPEGHLYALSKEDGKLLELLVGESDVLIKGLSQNGINPSWWHNDVTNITLLNNFII